MSVGHVKKFQNRPIEASYGTPDEKFCESLRQGSGVVELKKKKGLALDPRYFKKEVVGATERMFLRESVLAALEKAIGLLAPDYGVVVFDAYRSKEAQKGLFEAYYYEIKAKNLSMSDAEVHRETRKYVAHPEEPSRFEIAPHLSGGAVDLGLTRRGKVVNLGTDFDELSEQASTAFFEQPFDPSGPTPKAEWLNIRDHRRILFHALCSVGFTNWKHEWWHYDLGNCVWSQELGVPWIFDSMEKQVGANL